MELKVLSSIKTSDWDLIQGDVVDVDDETFAQRMIDQGFAVEATPDDIAGADEVKHRSPPPEEPKQEEGQPASGDEYPSNPPDFG